jgi:hypothetical protein
MIANSAFIVKTWTGEEKACKKVALYPERDGSGELFYKIEGQLNTDYFMISYYYDQEQAKKEYYLILDSLMAYQIKDLQSY